MHLWRRIKDSRTIDCMLVITMLVITLLMSPLKSYKKKAPLSCMVYKKKKNISLHWYTFLLAVPITNTPCHVFDKPLPIILENRNN